MAKPKYPSRRQRRSDEISALRLLLVLLSRASLRRAGRRQAKRVPRSAGWGTIAFLVLQRSRGTPLVLRLFRESDGGCGRSAERGQAP